MFARCIFSLVFLTVTSPAFAQRGGERLSSARLRDGKETRTAFREIAKAANAATVNVQIAGKDALLGTVVSADGYIATKYSELKSPVSVRLADGKTFDAKVIGHAPQYDIALLKIDAKNLSAAKFTEGKTNVAVGQFVATATSGDIPEAIGVVSVPRRKIPPRSGVLGIQLDEADGGAKIVQIFPGSGAEQAGLKVGDIVTAVAEKAVANRESLITTVRKYQAGDTVPLVIRRGEDEVKVTATLTSPGVLGEAGRDERMNSLGGTLSNRAADFPNVIQHDTALNANECGGPLVDLSGNVLGINIARAGRTESFAIPTDALLPLLAEMKAGKLAPKKELPAGK